MSSAAAATGGVKIKIPLAAKEGCGGKGKGVPLSEAKKRVDSSGKTPSIIKQKTTTVVAKAEVKGKTTSSTKTVTKTTVRARAVKKVYSLPGQKYDIPEEREPLRIFYESLLEQIPSSEMAEIWMMEHGLLSPEKAKKAFDRKQRKNHLSKTTPDPIKTYKQERPESSKKSQDPKNGDVKAKKRFNPSDDDDDFIVKAKKTK